MTEVLNNHSCWCVEEKPYGARTKQTREQEVFVVIQQEMLVADQPEPVDFLRDWTWGLKKEWNQGLCLRFRLNKFGDEITCE